MLITSAFRKLNLEDHHEFKTRQSYIVSSFTQEKGSDILDKWIKMS